MVIEGLNIAINIKLENGIYVIYGDSASGRTYLCNKLNQYRHLGYNVLGYTYNDYVKGFDLQSVRNIESLDVLMIDRYDLYCSRDFNKFLLSIKDKMIILVDCKNKSYVSRARRCEIELGNKNIEVYK